MAFLALIHCSNRQGSMVERGLKPAKGKISLASSDTNLVKSFRWAKIQALAYVFEGDPVGDWYEAALPGREAFCMRDVSHQSMGANALGLQQHTLNMLTRFAENISESKDWCSYWEINRSNKPAPVDYRNDDEFWYNLPANFDVLDCSWRQYLWTGDATYLNAPVFLNFYDRTVFDYVARWDLSLERIMDRPRHMNLSVPLDMNDAYRTARGLPSYHEGDHNVVVGVDLLAVQSAGYRAYANIQGLRGNRDAEAAFHAKARAVASFIHEKWWDKESQAYYSAYLGDGRFKQSQGNHAMVYYGVAAQGRADMVMNNLMAIRDKMNIEVLSHYPEILYRHNRNEEAYAMLLHCSDENTSRREYPEVSFAVIGAIVNGMMGIQPDATEGAVYTLPRLSRLTDWAGLVNVPVLNREIDVRHNGGRETILRNNGNEPLKWVAQFAGRHERLFVNGEERSATDSVVNGLVISSIAVVVEPGESYSVSTFRR